MIRARLRVGGKDAARLVRLAQQLEQTPSTSQALAEGTLCPESAAVIARTVTSAPPTVTDEQRAEAERMMLGFADDYDPEALRRLAARVRDRLAPDGPDALAQAEERAYRNRELWLSDVGDQWVLRATLDREVGGQLHAMIGAIVSSMVRTSTADDLVLPPQRRADAFAEVMRLAVQSGGLPEHGGQQPCLTVTTDLAALQGVPGAAPALIDDGTPLSTAALRRLACDAMVIPAVLGTRGDPLDLGRASRLVSTALRRALVLRDGGCAWPGCDRPPAFTDAHHIVHWADGGPTSLLNTVLLCRTHHRTAHKEHWAIRLALGQIEFVPPTWVDPLQLPRRNNRDLHVDLDRHLRFTRAGPASLDTSDP